MGEKREGLKFYRCNTCGNLFFVMIDPNVRPSCCGAEMEVIDTTHGTEGSEKHAPIITISQNDTEVQVGLQKLGLSTPPVVKFSKMNGAGKVRAYAFCNIHGLWESEK